MKRRRIGEIIVENGYDRWALTALENANLPVAFKLAIIWNCNSYRGAVGIITERTWALQW